MAHSELDRIKDDLLAKHGSLDAPDFHFRWKAIETKPYRDFVDEALTHFFIKDSTDLNQDGCFVYSVLCELNQRCIVQLSMVGRYGVVFRVENPRPSLLYEDTPNLSASEVLILKLVRKHRISLLSEEVLMEPITMKLDYADPENVHIYQALFSDTDTLPWRAR